MRSSGGSQEFVADAPAAKSCAANLEEGEINEEAASPGPTAVDGGDVLPPRARKPRARVDN